MVRSIVDGGWTLNQLVVDGHDLKKKSHLKEGLLGEALGEGNQPLKLFSKDGSLLEFPQNIVEGLFCEDVIVRFEESWSSKLKLGCRSTGEVHPLDGM